MADLRVHLVPVTGSCFAAHAAGEAVELGRALVQRVDEQVQRARVVRVPPVAVPPAALGTRGREDLTVEVPRADQPITGPASPVPVTAPERDRRGHKGERR
jgi:hypothetical protein